MSLGILNPINYLYIILNYLEKIKIESKIRHFIMLDNILPICVEHSSII